MTGGWYWHLCTPYDFNFVRGVYIFFCYSDVIDEIDFAKLCYNSVDNGMNALYVCCNENGFSISKLNSPGFYFLVTHRDTLQFFRNISIIINRFFNPVIHFTPVIMNFQLGDPDLMIWICYSNNSLWIHKFFFLLITILICFLVSGDGSEKSTVFFRSSLIISITSFPAANPCRAR